MRRLVRAIRRLIFRSRDRDARKAGAYLFNHIEPCVSQMFADKRDSFSPEKGWRLIAHINCTDTTAKTDQARDIELDEELLERIDFLACLFGNRKSY